MTRDPQPLRRQARRINRSTRWGSQVRAPVVGRGKIQSCSKASPKPRFSTTPRYDPTKPTKGWRTAWRKLTEKAGLPGLRGHDLRHNWITSHAEIGTPQSVLEAQAGHLSKRMSDHYKHISERAARKASDELARVRTEQRAQARAKLQELANRELMIDSTVMPAVVDVLNSPPVH